MDILAIKEEIELDFLKSKSYTEINRMFNDLNVIIKSQKKENERLKQEIKILKQNAQIAINDKNHRKKILSDTVEELANIKELHTLALNLNADLEMEKRSLKNQLKSK